MTIMDAIFLVFAALALLSAVGILLTKNVIHAAFLLVLCLLSFAALYVLYDATFLAVVQLLVYAGGVVVLLSFGTMLTSRAEGKLISGNHLLFPGVLLALFLGLMVALFARTALPIEEAARPTEQVEWIGMQFMTTHVLAFELIAFLLLLVLVGSAYIANQSRA